ncbi:hypothetical protein BH10PLA2_BH10PLA2_00920 [soil metagenome]
MRAGAPQPISWDELKRRIERYDQHLVGFSREYKLFQLGESALESEEKFEYLECLERLMREIRTARLVLVNALNRNEGRSKLSGPHKLV